MITLVVLVVIAGPITDVNAPMNRPQRAAIESLTETGRLPTGVAFWERAENRFERNPEGFAIFNPVKAALLQREADINAGVLTSASPFLTQDSFRFYDKAMRNYDSHFDRFTFWHPFLSKILEERDPPIGVGGGPGNGGGPPGEFPGGPPGGLPPGLGGELPPGFGGGLPGGPDGGGPGGSTPEPASIIQLATALGMLMLFYCFTRLKRRRINDQETY